MIRKSQLSLLRDRLYVSMEKFNSLKLFRVWVNKGVIRGMFLSVVVSITVGLDGGAIGENKIPPIYRAIYGNLYDLFLHCQKKKKKRSDKVSDEEKKIFKRKLEIFDWL